METWRAIYLQEMSWLVSTAVQVLRNLWQYSVYWMTPTLSLVQWKGHPMFCDCPVHRLKLTPGHHAKERPIWHRVQASSSPWEGQSHPWCLALSYTLTQFFFQTFPMHRVALMNRLELCGFAHFETQFSLKISFSFCVMASETPDDSSLLSSFTNTSIWIIFVPWWML